MAVPKQAMEQLEKAEQAMERDMAKARAREQAQEPAQSQEHPPVKPETNSSPETANGHIAEQPHVEIKHDAAPSADEAVERLRSELDRERQLRKTLEGRLRTQLKPANEEVKRLREELQETEERIRRIEQSNKAPGAERLLSEEERRELGDVLDVNSRMVKGILEEESEAGGSIGDLVEQLVNKSLEARQTQSSQASGPSEDFWPLVEDYCPGARDMNRLRDARWLEFLGFHNAATGEKNRTIAEQAMANDDPISLADLFVQCKRHYGIVDNPGDQPNEERQSSTRTVKPEAAGGSSVTPANRNGNQPEPWTKSEVLAFYTDVSKGKFKGKPKEQARYEAEIQAAASAGLITRG